MGDFEDVFGAGADADAIIARYSRDYSKATHLERVNWFGTASMEAQKYALDKDDYEEWCMHLSKSGGTKGPDFDSYAAMEKWDKQNKLPHVRRRKPSGGFQVFFTNET